jgi:hypothetical protein
MFLKGDGPAINHQPKNSFAIRGPARLARWAGWMSRRSLPCGGKGWTMGKANSPEGVTEIHFPESSDRCRSPFSRAS